MKHELWLEPDGCQTFCLAGVHGDDARNLPSANSKLIWMVEADSHFEAMTKYYSFMAWGECQADFPAQDQITYAELGWGE
ncbi:hypothetical protein [Pseudomonas sp. PA-1-3F]|uniref:hypothetical protein n=1 Tax=Pseudomonas sp. PA-1-3F TaxID=2665465 RepID=UPI001F21A780|nr:hypothetical protein [Pseudomonas sp. PA-1-3F]MCF5686834.1 hypothetical protein [Pseudomonas sp. PA-1-3F]